ncbi:unnamed protein product, partial [marine sediment metagenome]
IESKMRNILITGSNGFLGSHLIDLCIKKDFKIYGLDRPSSSFRNLTRYTNGIEFFSKKHKKKFLGKKIQIASNRKNLIFLECDIKNRSLLEKIIEGIKPNLLFHFGAQPYIIPSWEDPVNTIETNVIGTINVFEPIKKYNLKTRVILACSATEFGTSTNINREKLDIYSDDPNKLQIMAVLYKVLFDVLLMLAPINPMLSEELYLKMFKPDLKSMGLEETKSIHLQNWPEADKTKIDEKLEEEMRFVRDLIESIRALKEENKIRLRWPNKRIIIEPKEDMPEIGFPEIIKQIGNVKELEIKKSVKSADNLRKIEHKYCNIYLDVSVDDELLNERVVNDLIRNIQFSRKK